MVSTPHDSGVTLTQARRHSHPLIAATTALVALLGFALVAPGAAGDSVDAGDSSGDAQPSAASTKAQAPLRRFEARWKRVASGLAQPTEVTSAPDGRKRLFVVQKAGSVRIVRDGRVAAKPYLSIKGRIDPGGEGGLLSLAFSPSFRKDGLLWVTYTSDGNQDVVVARMRARNAAADHVATKTLRTVLRVKHPTYDNHFGGQLAFGPNKRLYVGLGDGGGGGDPFNAAGNKNDLRGKILRINPYGNCGERRYCVPNGNPFVGKRGRDEIWLMGLRNPWRFSFDARTNDLWIGDVGQESYEEINRVGPHPRRIHLGWSCKEGRSTYRADRCNGSTKYLGPETVVPQDAAQSITGGYVYRGQRFQRQLGGTYVFADFVTRRVWLYRPGAGRVLQPQRLGSGIGATSFGVDDRGEIYAVTYDGVLWRMRVERR